MENDEDLIEACELLKIWFHLQKTCWPGAKGALEKRITTLTMRYDDTLPR